MTKKDIEKQNKKALDYQLSCVAFTEKISQPLSYLGITSFAYIRVFDTGAYFQTCNDKDWLRYYVPHVKNNGNFFPNKIATLSQNDYHLILSPQAPPQGEEILWPLREKFGLWNFLSIMHKQQGYVDCWTFMAPRDRTEINDTYIRSLGLLKDYIRSFKFHSQKVFNLTKGNLALFPDSLNLKASIQSNPPKDTSTIDAFKKRIRQKNFLQVKEQFIELSKRESQCFYLYTQGQTIKKIADKLTLSPRTIETYLYKLKMKTGVRYKSELMDIYYQQLF